MTEATDTPQGGAEDVNASEAVESISEATTEQQTGADEAGQADDAGEVTEKPKQVPWFQKRIDEVTAKKYEAEREAAYWRGIAEANRNPQPQTQQPEADNLPTLEQFDYDESRYAAALAQHFEKRAEQAIDTKLTERERHVAETQKNTTALTKLSEAGQKYSDFHAAVSDLPANEAIRDFILEEPTAADVLYELGRDPVASARFNSLPLHLQALELGRRAASTAIPKPNNRTIAPPPPQTVGGLSAGMTKAPEQMSYDEYKEWRAKGGGA